ncbi:hypothetical protein [Xanthomonas citri]|uniref:hypothetical protein n=1 Tax=Xanthomonas citri TaxID=346 RepID=UPI00103FD4B7|nr:hypothetical protein [Xanthomonas citri]TBW96692.1 hypothetical protein TP49_11770 [Xanthomonas citri pv. aurantifolii]
MIELTLPWPDKRLSPNSRCHWAQRAKAAKAAKAEAHALAVAAGWQSVILPAGRLHLWIQFYAPTRMRPDDDNMLARLKGARDGIAAALGIDDRRFVSHPQVMDETRKGGQVVIRMTGHLA